MTKFTENVNIIEIYDDYLKKKGKAHKMGTDWEATFRKWSKPPSDTEQVKADNAVKAINDAIRSHGGFSSMNVDVFLKGSYRANTNVRLDSDVDVCVRLKRTIFFHIPQECTPEEFGISVPGTDNYSDFKNLVETALVDKFGRSNVSRGNKAIEIHESTNRLDADVVAAFEYKRYDSKGSSPHLGTKFNSDDGKGIINWPEQNYKNGTDKNNNTGYRYKAMVRALKMLRNHMQGAGITDANDIASFLIESLVWNVPDEGFNHDEYKSDMRYVLAHTFNETKEDDKCKEWREVNDLKYLFNSAQPWTREKAHSFLAAAWDYVGFE